MVSVYSTIHGISCRRSPHWIATRNTFGVWTSLDGLLLPWATHAAVALSPRYLLRECKHRPRYALSFALKRMVWKRFQLRNIRFHDFTPRKFGDYTLSSVYIYVSGPRDNFFLQRRSTKLSRESPCNRINPCRRIRIFGLATPSTLLDPQKRLPNIGHGSASNSPQRISTERHEITCRPIFAASHRFPSLTVRD